MESLPPGTEGAAGWRSPCRSLGSSCNGAPATGEGGALRGAGSKSAIAAVKRPGGADCRRGLLYAPNCVQ